MPQLITLDALKAEWNGPNFHPIIKYVLGNEAIIKCMLFNRKMWITVYNIRKASFDNVTTYHIFVAVVTTKNLLINYPKI